MLASLDVAEEPTRAMFAKLSKNQARIEKWAHALNSSFSTLYGSMLAMTTAWVFLPIVLIFVFMGSSSEFGAGGIACLSVLALMPVTKFFAEHFSTHCIGIHHCRQCCSVIFP